MTWMWPILGFRSFDIRLLKAKFKHLRKIWFQPPPSPLSTSRLVPLPTSSVWGQKVQENPMWPRTSDSAFICLLWIPPSCLHHSSPHPYFRNQSRCLLTPSILFVSTAFSSNFLHMVVSLPHKRGFWFFSPLYQKRFDWGYKKNCLLRCVTYCF